VVRRLLAWTALVLVVLCPPVLWALQVPSYAGPVTDAAGVLSPDQTARLSQKILDYRRGSGNEIGVLIVKSLEGQSLDDFAADVFKKWGIGRDQKDNGVLFLVAVEDHKARVEVGYGLEGDLTDAEAGRLVQRNSPMADQFRKNDYYGGVNAVLDGIVAAIGGEYKPQGSDDDSRSQKRFPIAGALFLGFILLNIIARRRSGFWGGPGGFITGAMLGGMGGRGFGGGGGGGGFTFGGGSSGGGGASGGW
jgi:uncharacterized protein